MDMLTSGEIAAADLADWRQLAQGLHARYLVPDLAAAARFVAAMADTAPADAAELAPHAPHVTIGAGFVELKLVSDDAVYRDDDGIEHAVQWVTQQDVDLARKVTAVAAEHGLTADPSGVVVMELGLDAADSARVAPFWAHLLTGDPAAQGRGTPGDEVRDAGARIPNLWFDDPSDSSSDSPAQADGSTAQRFHVEVYVAPEVVQQRIDAAVAAGGTIVDDSQSPSLTVLADPEGNRGVICSPSVNG